MQIKSLKDIATLPWDTQMNDCMKAAEEYVYANCNTAEEALEVVREVDFHGFGIPRERIINLNDVRSWIEFEGIELERLKFKIDMAFEQDPRDPPDAPHNQVDANCSTC